MKKGQGLSINIIVISAIAVIVLVVLIINFTDIEENKFDPERDYCLLYNNAPNIYCIEWKEKVDITIDDFRGGGHYCNSLAEDSFVCKKGIETCFKLLGQVECMELPELYQNESSTNMTGCHNQTNGVCST